MGDSVRAKSFYIAGGTLPSGWPWYVERSADCQLLQHILNGQLCHVFAPRQMGKSSLMVHATRDLLERGIQVAAIDLTSIGVAPSREWHLGLLGQLISHLHLSVDPYAWWQQHRSLSTERRLVAFLRYVVLQQVPVQTVIFLDEIDSMLRLDFRDDLFAAIRAVYHSRRTDAEFNRLTFVLLGTVLPGDLIRRSEQSLFAISHGVDLLEFTPQDAQVLHQGLDQTCSDKAGEVMASILHWTSGHPYLIQKLCACMLGTPLEQWDAKGVNQIVDQILLSGATHSDANLQTIDNYMVTSRRRKHLLALYRKVYEGQRVLDDRRSVDQTRLKLYGLVRAQDGVLTVRNEIYRQVFNSSWIKKKTLASY